MQRDGTFAADGRGPGPARQDGAVDGVSGRAVTHGVYGVIRHPSYLELLVNAFGWGLVFRSGVGVLFAVASSSPLIARIHAEAALLHAQFGN